MNEIPLGRQEEIKDHVARNIEARNEEAYMREFVNMREELDKRVTSRVE
jgi:hypothetical protein